MQKRKETATVFSSITMWINTVLVLALSFGGQNFLTNPFTSEYWQNFQKNVIHQEAAPSPKPKPKIKSIQKKVASTINSQQVLVALNSYRSANGIPTLHIDQSLQNYAKSRSNYLESIGKMDNHAGFNDYIQNQNGFNKLGFNSLAENQSWNYKGSADGLISEFYAKSPAHNATQLDPQYTHVGIGISGIYTDLVFGGRKQ